MKYPNNLFDFGVWSFLWAEKFVQMTFMQLLKWYNQYSYWSFNRKNFPDETTSSN